MSPNIMTLFCITVVMTVCLTILTVNLVSMNTVRQIIDASNSVPVQVSSNQQQQDDELRCDFTGSDAQEVRRRKFFVHEDPIQQEDPWTSAAVTHRR